MDSACAQELHALRELLNERQIAHDREHAMLRDALGKAEGAVNQRLEGMNELRAQINAERGAYLSTSTYEAKHEVLVEKINRLEQQGANTSGRFWALGVGLTLIVITINVALHFLK